MRDTAKLQPALSIVIPAYNEAARLPTSLEALRRYLTTLPYPSEVVVADDGSTDGTSAVVKRLIRAWRTPPVLRLVSGPHLGKGGAVRAGVLAATGDYIALADADFSMPVAEFDRFKPSALGAYDLAIGSREAPGARRYDEPLHRHLMGRAFNALVQLLLLSGIQDTQCGFKCLRREVAHELCRRQTISGWGFDVELLYMARKRGYRIREVPISWHYMPGSRINPLRDTLTMLRDILTIRANGARGHYDAPVAMSAPVAILAKSLPPVSPPVSDSMSVHTAE
ncbi:MAG TPA: dolichyl-phosphate beta-glucosyltransferase [Ktedonobacterales bacterium]